MCGLFVCLVRDKEKKVVWFLLLYSDPDCSVLHIFIGWFCLFFPYCLFKMLIDPIMDKDRTVKIKHLTIPLDHQLHVLVSRELFISASKHLYTIQPYYIT